MKFFLRQIIDQNLYFFIVIVLFLFSIQSHREEYGDRGASLKAFRMDQEEAKQRVHSLLDDEDETPKTESGMNFHKFSKCVKFLVS